MLNIFFFIYTFYLAATQCNTTTCTAPRGYIEFHNGNPNRQWTISASDSTTFVVIVRNISVRKTPHILIESNEKLIK